MHFLFYYYRNTIVCELPVCYTSHMFCLHSQITIYIQPVTLHTSHFTLLCMLGAVRIERQLAIPDHLPPPPCHLRNGFIFAYRSTPFGFTRWFHFIRNPPFLIFVLDLISQPKYSTNSFLSIFCPFYETAPIFQPPSYCKLH